MSLNALGRSALNWHFCFTALCFVVLYKFLSACLFVRKCEFSLKRSVCHTRHVSHLTCWEPDTWIATEGNLNISEGKEGQSAFCSSNMMAALGNLMTQVDRRRKPLRLKEPTFGMQGGSKTQNPSLTKEDTSARRGGGCNLESMFWRPTEGEVWRTRAREKGTFSISRS